jgi:Tfp pilus assembly protein PilO
VLKQLKSSFPSEISEANLIEIITQYAEQHAITIESFSQASKNDLKSYQTISLSITVSTTSYDDLWKFIARLEAKKTIRIDTLRCSPGGARIIRSATPRSETITANLTLTAVNFKNA